MFPQIKGADNWKKQKKFRQNGGSTVKNLFIFLSQCKIGVNNYSIGNDSSLIWKKDRFWSGELPGEKAYRIDIIALKNIYTIIICEIRNNSPPHSGIIRCFA